MASSNTLLTPTIIAKVMLSELIGSRAMASKVNTQYKNEFVKKGATVTIRKPNKFRATDTQARSNTNLSEPSTSITVDKQSHVSWAFSGAELALTIEEYNKRYIKPAATALAAKVDYNLCQLYSDIYNYVGTPGTTPSTFSVLGDANEAIDNEMGPSDGRVAIVNPKANWALADGLKGTFAQNVAKNIITKGYLGTIANLDIYMDQKVARHTCGAFEADIQVTSEPASGATSLVTKNWDGSSTVKKGDIFTVSGVYAVDPETGVSTGVLRRFVVTADTSDTTTAMTIPCSPAIINSGAYQTVDSLPQVNANVTFIGTASTAYAQNLVFCPETFGMVTVPLEVPASVWGARETDPESGLSVTVIKDFNIETYEDICRVDILYGIKTFYPETGCRIWGA